MSAKKLPTISSSESEESDADELTEVIEEKKPHGVLSLSETRDEILSKIKGVKYDFNDVAKSNFRYILYSNDITEDDEIWLMQTPKSVNLKSLSNFDINLDEDVSQISLKVHKKNKIYNAHSVRCSNERINTVLPNRKTSSFHLNVHPIAGRVILQEEIELNEKNQSINNSLADFSLNGDVNRSSHVSFNQSQNFEEVTKSNESSPSKKRKRKSTT